jgi:hypothetical protein
MGAPRLLHHDGSDTAKDCGEGALSRSDSALVSAISEGADSEVETEG